MRSHPTRFEYLLEALKTPPKDKAACMEWPYNLVRGYGMLDTEGGKRYVHRMAYILHYGPILPGNWFICHKCDNPKCFRPSHLFLGTPADNTHDSIKKRRYNQRGEANNGSKLTEALVREMNTLYLSGKTRASLANQFGISWQQAASIVNQESWSHLTDLSWNR